MSQEIFANYVMDFSRACGLLKRGTPVTFNVFRAYSSKVGGSIFLLPTDRRQSAGLFVLPPGRTDPRPRYRVRVIPKKGVEI